ncbi:MAG: transposase [Balneolales bacterium]
MNLKKRRTNFTPEEKVTILSERLLEGVAVNDLCELHNIQPSQYYHWQKQLFMNGTIVFRNNHNSKTKSLEQENARLRSKIAEKDEVIAEVIQEYVKLKKDLA